MRANQDVSIAFVIPVFNEREAIRKLLLEINSKILSINNSVDIFVFEDGSTDGTKDVLRTFLETQSISRLHINMTADRKGYPKAVRDAITSIDPLKYKYLLFMDGDGQYYMEDVLKLMEINRRDNFKYDMIIGSRKKRVEPIWRKVLTYGIRSLERIFFNSSIKDVTSALRLMKIEVAQGIASSVKYSKYNFWLEFSARMSALNLETLEVPVDYMKRKEGESQVYNLKKMPKIVWAEFSAVARTWSDIHWRSLIRFAFVGATGAVLILFITWLLTEQAKLWYMSSAGIAIESSILWAFVLNTKITFKHRFRSSNDFLKAIAKYHVTSFGGLIINLIVLYILTEYFVVYYLVSEVVAILMAFGFNYLLSVKYVWPKSQLPTCQETID